MKKTKQKIKKIRIDAEFGLNDDKEVIWFMTQVKGKVDENNVLMTAMDVLGDVIDSILENKSQEQNRENFIAIQDHINGIKHNVPGLGVDGAIVIKESNLGRQYKSCKWKHHGLEDDCCDLDEKLKTAIAEGNNELAVSIQKDLDLLCKMFSENSYKWRKIEDEIEKYEKKHPRVILQHPEKVSVEDDENELPF